MWCLHFRHFWSDFFLHFDNTHFYYLYYFIVFQNHCGRFFIGYHLHSTGYERWNCRCLINTLMNNYKNVNRYFLLINYVYAFSGFVTSRELPMKEPLPSELLLLLLSLLYRVCHGFRIMKEDDCFQVNFDHF